MVYQESTIPIHWTAISPVKSTEIQFSHITRYWNCLLLPLVISRVSRIWVLQLKAYKTTISCSTPSQSLPPFKKPSNLGEGAVIFKYRGWKSRASRMTAKYLETFELGGGGGTAMVTLIRWLPAHVSRHDGNYLLLKPCLIQNTNYVCSEDSAKKTVIVSRSPCPAY